MNIFEKFKLAMQRDRIITAIQSFDVNGLNLILKEGVKVNHLAKNKNLFWDVQKNFLPEAANLQAFNEDERTQLEKISRRLAKGNKLLKVLGLETFGENYSLFGLMENTLKGNEDISTLNQLGIIMRERFANHKRKNLDGALWLAASPEALKVMLTQGGNVNFTDNAGWTALHYLALAPSGKYFKPAEMVKILLDAGANPNAKSHNKITPLMLAAYGICSNFDNSEHVKISLMLAEHSADSKARDKHGNDIKFWADVKNPGEARNVCESFIEELENYSPKSREEINFMAAILTGNFDAVKENLSRVNINFQTTSGYTPLMFALHKENTKILRLLLKNGADTNIKNFLVETALLYAVRWNGLNKSAVKILLNAGANINAQDNDGNTILMHKTEHGIIKFLLDNGADVSIKNNEGNSALDIFLNNDNENAENLNSLRLLIQQGIFLNDDGSSLAYGYIDNRMYQDVMMLGLKMGGTFEEVIKKNGAKKLIEAVKGGFSMEARDENQITLPEAAMNAREPELLKACIMTGERESENYSVQDISEGLLEIAMNNYDVDGVKILLDVGVCTELTKNFSWHFAANYIPEANDPENEAAKIFKQHLDRGTEILNLLHKFAPEIPIHDGDGKILSYSHVDVYQDWDAEVLPLKDNEISRLRHAVSFEAVCEVIESFSELNFNADVTYEVPQENFNDEDDDEPETFEEITEKLSRRFSPEDFVTRTDEEEQEQKNFFSSLLDAENFGKNILHLVADNYGEYFEPERVIQLLCEFGTDLNMRNDDGITPAIMLVKNLTPFSKQEYFSAEALKSLCNFIYFEADLELQDDKGFSVRKFLDDEDYSNDEKFKENICSGSYFLRRLIFTDVIHTFLNGGNVDLFIATFGNDTRKISAALESGSKIEAKTAKGYTPLMFASMFGTSETVKFLLEKGANVKVSDRFGNNLVALNVLAGGGNNEILCALVEAGADLNSKNNYGVTPLMQTLEENSPDDKKLSKIRTLLSLGADPEIKNDKGENVMKIAASEGKYRAVKELLISGVNFYE